jgi:hypothetical protein
MNADNKTGFESVCFSLNACLRPTEPGFTLCVLGVSAVQKDRSRYRPLQISVLRSIAY